jgi:prepilin-type N-terminal cleavage/methylation domain-containing protein
VKFAPERLTPGEVGADGETMIRTTTRAALRRVRNRLSPGAEGGFTLIEMLVVMAVMLALLAGITGAYVSAMTAQVDQTRRLDAQENARLALDRMRKDIHCAHGVTDPYANDSSGYTIVMTETNVTGTAECPGLVQTNASAVQWCTVPVAGAPNRYQLFRENDPDQQCDGADATFMTDYLTRGDPWASPTCVIGQYATVEVTMPVDVDPSKAPGSYQLGDEIALRNGDICS